MTEAFNLAQGWSDEDRHKLFVERERVLISLHDGKPIDFGNHIGVIATLTLMHQGFVELDRANPLNMLLTDAGQRFASGTVALSHGQ